MKKLALSIFAGLILSFSAASSSFAITFLPDPNTIIAPGETIALLHDDFYAYSAPLNTLLGYEGFDESTGTGGLDVLIYSGAVGQDNNPVGGGFIFEDPLVAPSGSATDFQGVWGAGLGTDGPVLVDNLYNYLDTVFGVSIPVFSFDMNQAKGQGIDIYVAGEVFLWDPDTSTKVKSWALDSIANDVFDAPNQTDITDPKWVKADGVLNLGPGLEVDHNKGSGRLDYVAYAPTMDLSLYTGKGYQFHADFRLSGLSGGHEELFLTGAFAPTPSHAVPEPTSMALFGIGVAGAFIRRKFVG